MSETSKPHSELLDVLHDLALEYPGDVSFIRAELERLEEQLEALQRAARKFLASGNEIDLADLTTPGEYLWDLIPYEWPNRLHTDDYPASEPKEDA